MVYQRPTSTLHRRRISKTGQDGAHDRDSLAWAEAHRGKPAYKTAPSAGRAVARVVKPLSDQFGMSANQLAAKWSLIVGQRLAQWSYPERLHNGARGLTLVVCARGPAALQIEAQSQLILQRIRDYTGKSPSALQVRQGVIKKDEVSGSPLEGRITKVSTPTLTRATDTDARLAQCFADWDREIAAQNQPSRKR
ncbi:DciA family protein [Woodsholea maritima]|uniref:DciA family protein n=1 Tax=Woodsholea maritima TaxID=240237 RepID=UPI001461602E|nr:DciA family protein [Woodsholea maritima]